MDKLADALADALRAGVPAAESIGKAYFNFRIWDDVITYGAPCVTWIIIIAIVTYTIRWGIKAAIEADDRNRAAYKERNRV